MAENPRGPIPPTYDADLGEPGVAVQQSLVEQLGAVVDDIRQIARDPAIGLVPYTVHAVRLRWTGGQVGRGEAETVLDLPLLPTPMVNGLGDTARELKEGGSIERGDIRVTEVSPRYTEDELISYFGQTDDEEGFLEVRIDERDGDTKRRRYVISRPPERRADLLDWKLVCRRQDGDRQRDGSRRPERERVWR
jgi:hypothetical protein